jgi:hypothetical protein
MGVPLLGLWRTALLDAVHTADAERFAREHFV